MAYAAVRSLSETIDIILNYHQDYTTPEFQNQIISLQKHSVFLQSFLQDFPDRGNNWDETIREVTDRAEEIVELLLSDSFLQSKSTVGSSKSEVDYDLHELEGVTEEMESIANRLKGGKRSEATDGSDEELMKIVSLLRGGSSSEVETIAIIGMGGMGKTTLARNAYNHASIVEHFEVRAWATLSYPNDPRRIAADLLRSMKADGDDERDLHRELYSRRYLIVFNEIWSFEAWQSLRRVLPNNGNGSRIILTTRAQDVARAAGAGYIHKMRLLDEDQTWNLLREKIFRGDPCPPQLEPIGKMIAGSCKGHPLCIEVVSGILAAADQTESAWKDVSDNIKIASEDDSHYRFFAFNILSVSYMYLPHRLRPCFLYLGCFPEDHEIYVSKLVKLWVAEGFLNETEFKSFEEIGEGHVEELVKRNLVSVSTRKSNGRIKSITIHDLVREVCLTQAQIDNFVLQVGEFDRHIEARKLESYRRVSTSTYKYNIFEGVYGSTIRTIMLYLKKSEARVIRLLVENVRLLRILDLSNACNIDLAEEVFELFHLRYLAFNSRFSISEAISTLENLQTLIICPRKNYGKLTIDKLPQGIWRMHQLRHLIVFPFELPSQQGATTSVLQNLEMLSGVVDFICSRENLKMFPNLKKLGIFYSKIFRDAVEDYEFHNLIYLKKLEILKIGMNWSFKKEMRTRCAFPPTLKKLNMRGVQLAWEDMKIVAALPNLQVLKLRERACIGETWETSERGFSQLTYLLIEKSNLKHWITESSHFPRLKCLVLRRCLHLLGVPINMGKVPTLELIELDNQNNSLLSSTKRIQEDRQSLGYDGLQIRLL